MNKRAYVLLGGVNLAYLLGLFTVEILFPSKMSVTQWLILAGAVGALAGLYARQHISR